ncbi:MAG: hypothetical protein N2171_01035 [Clostridia bacterium]|nr:hypothetical protein [Clostridia bacterium]
MLIRNAFCYADRVRCKYGTKALKSAFCSMAEQDKQSAADFINNKKLKFSSLFLLIPEIFKLSVYEYLNQRNKLAIKLCGKMLKNQDIISKSGKISLEDEEAIPQVLKWILLTGAADDGLCDDYDEILDFTASLLINTYHDKTILPILANLIFKRNRNGYYIHDLVWVFFHCYDSDALKLIARYLRSNEPSDIKLACKLLGLNAEEFNVKKRYSEYLAYLKENEPYLRFTGESFLRTSRPRPYNVDWDAKYLCKNADDNLAQTEIALLDAFHSAEDNTKEILCRYSQKLHRKSVDAWKQWLHNPIEEQIKIAAAKLGGRK